MDTFDSSLETSSAFQSPGTAEGSIRQAAMSFLHRNSLVVTGIVVTIWLIYFPVISFQFLNWDDTWYIVRNDLIKSWHPFHLYRILTEPVARNFAPLTVGSFLIEHSLWGLWPGGYHLTNVLLHSLNAVLVYALVRRFTKNDLAAWFVASVFAVHPLQVETVAWVSSRKTLLSATFMLASLSCWLREDRTAKYEGWGTVWLILGLASKAATVVIPPIVVAYDVIICRKKLAESIARQVVPMFFCVMLILLTMSAQTSIVGGVRSHIGASKLWLLGVDATILWRYVAMQILPLGQSVLYDPPTTGIGHWVILALTGWLAIMWWSFRNYRRYPLLVFNMAVWILLLVPVLNLFPITTLMNDRYLYLPIIPFFGAMLLGVRYLMDTVGKATFLTPIRSLSSGMVLSVLVIGSYSSATLNYLPVWARPLNLWHHAQATTPSLTVVQIQWALTLKQEGHLNSSLAALDYALTHCNPDDLDRQRIEKLTNEITEDLQVVDDAMAASTTTKRQILH